MESCGEGFSYSVVEATVRFLNCGTISPNEVTILRAILLLYAYILVIDAQGTGILATLMFVVAIWLDDLDGCLAKMCNQTSKLGASLDRWVDACNMFAVVALIIWGYQRKRIGKRDLVRIGAVYVILMIVWATLTKAPPFGLTTNWRPPLARMLPSAFEGLRPFAEDICLIVTFALYACIVYAFRRKEEQQ
jgi:phosphatidylserine synthase